jgi:hypothetical protein
MCRTEACEQYGKVYENYFRHWNNPNPNCEACGVQRGRLVSAANPVWLKCISEYGDPKKEFYREGIRDGGHLVWRKKSSRRPDGKPEAQWITNIQEQRAYCREEGLIPPDEMPSHMTIDKSGTRVSSAGLPGCWA